MNNFLETTPEIQVLGGWKKLQEISTEGRHVDEVVAEVLKLVEDALNDNLDYHGFRAHIRLNWHSDKPGYGEPSVGMYSGATRLMADQIRMARGGKPTGELMGK